MKNLIQAHFPIDKMPLKVTFFFDTISPYTYFAWANLLRYKKVWDLNIVLKPMFLGGVMSGTGNQPPAMLAPRAVFTANDVMRNAALYNVPVLASPGNFFSEAAKKVLTVQRMLVGRMIDGASEAEMETLLNNCFYAIHSDPKFRTEANDLVLNDATILTVLRASGLSETDAARSLKRAGDADVKNALQVNTKEAIECGAYGSPTLLIHGGKAPYYDGTNPWLVFGSDRFEQIAFVCGLPYLGANPDKAKM